MALFADAHGHTELLHQALRICEQERVEEIVLLGDLIDRSDQADSCALALAGWKVSGVFGNHEEQMMGALAIGDDLGLRPETIDLFMGLEPVIVIDNICFCHDGPPTARHNPMDHFFNRAPTPIVSPYHIVFMGHTHFRHVRDERGPLELAVNSVKINPHRRYSINPGALTAGQFAIWDREHSAVRFFTAHR
jgi:predicted phosphodiesterase